MSIYRFNRQQLNLLHLPPHFTVKEYQQEVNTSHTSNGGFHEGISSVLLMAQFFGIMPVSGIKAAKPTDLRLEWRSVRVVYSLLVIFGIFLMTAVTIYWLLSVDIEFGRIVTTIFYSSNLVTMILFLQLAQKWPGIMMRWHKVECNLPQQRTFFEVRRLSKRIKVVSLTVLSLSLGLVLYPDGLEIWRKRKLPHLSSFISGEHLLSIISGLPLYSIVHSNTEPDPHPIKSFFRVQLAQIFAVFDFNPVIAFLGKYINVVATFSWTYMDLFVMLISITLATRFKQVNEYLLIYKGKVRECCLQSLNGFRCFFNGSSFSDCA